MIDDILRPQLLCFPNRLMPRQHRLASWPSWLSRWIGYRAVPPPKRPDYIVWLWSFIGAFCGISVIQAVFGHAAYFIRRGVPSIVASYGASAVLIYGAIEAPLAQPRALIGGHFIGALTGVCITKLFHLLPTESRFQELLWLAGSLSCATSVVLMQMTGTTHPPAGATALLAAVNTEVRDMGWYYLPVVLLTSALALAVALLLNNIQRRYPAYWFHPAVPAVSLVDPELGGPEIKTAREEHLSEGLTEQRAEIFNTFDAAERLAETMRHPTPLHDTLYSQTIHETSILHDPVQSETELHVRRGAVPAKFGDFGSCSRPQRAKISLHCQARHGFGGPRSAVGFVANPLRCIKEAVVWSSSTCIRLGSS
ncbi:putative HPP family protein [Lyophyllum shimeji]|uniref:HPP family protein n=1 Tax=Lyophyllum shimeji TaxID=47721 RepID=A0A9P3PPY5_LYOSH|nr:putative HPP family protein [Lyophyllum shimeji]